MIPPQVFPLFWETNFKIVGRASVVEPHFSKVRETSIFCNSMENKVTRAWYVPKSGFSRYFEKSPFNRSCRFTVFSLQLYLKRTPNQISRMCFETYRKFSGGSLLEIYRPANYRLTCF